MLNDFRLSMGAQDSFADWMDNGRSVLESMWPKPSRRLDNFISAGGHDGDAIKKE